MDWPQGSMTVVPQSLDSESCRAVSETLVIAGEHVSAACATCSAHSAGNNKKDEPSALPFSMITYIQCGAAVAVRTKSRQLPTRKSEALATIGCQGPVRASDATPAILVDPVWQEVQDG